MQHYTYISIFIIFLILSPIVYSQQDIHNLEETNKKTLDLIEQTQKLREAQHINQFLFKLNSLPSEEIENRCNKLKNSLFTPFKCINQSEVEYDQIQYINGQRLGQQMKRDIDQMNRLLKKDNKPSLKPIVLIPGIAGSSLEAKLDKSSSPAWYCTKKSDWFRLWLSIEELFVQKCWFDNLAISYNPLSGTYSNTPGVDIRPVDFGGVNGISYLDYKLSFPVGVTNVYGEMVNFFKDLGYKPGVNLRGAPYDWRVSIRYLEKNGWFEAYKKLIEDTYTLNNGQRVVLISHSMGSLTALYFLQSMTSEWKSKYIDSFIPIAAPWSGSPKAIRTVISGDDMGVSLMSVNDMKQFSRQSGGVIQLIPDPVLWSRDRVFIKTPSLNYTLGQTDLLFQEIGLNITNSIYQNVTSIVSGMQPGVETHCLYGYGIQTEISYSYDKGFSQQPIIYDSDLGDGTVPLDSLKVCNKWIGNNYPVQVKEFHLAQHVDILTSKDVFSYIAGVIVIK